MAKYSDDFNIEDPELAAITQGVSDMTIRPGARTNVDQMFKSRTTPPRSKSVPLKKNETNSSRTKIASSKDVSIQVLQPQGQSAVVLGLVSKATVKAAPAPALGAEAATWQRQVSKSPTVKAAPAVNPQTQPDIWQQWRHTCIQKFSYEGRTFSDNKRPLDEGFVLSSAKRRKTVLFDATNVSHVRS